MNTLRRNVLLAALAAAGLVADAAAQDAPPSADAPQVWIGQIGLFAGRDCPDNWVAAQGQLLPIREYDALFSIFGVRYGGDGRDTFGAPDFRGRSPIDSGGPHDRDVGQKIGEETTRLTVANIAPHEHQFRASPNGPDTRNPHQASLATFPAHASAYAATSTLDHSMNDGMLEPMGRPDPFAFSVRQPTLAMTFCVATQGLYPRRPHR